MNRSFTSIFIFLISIVALAQAPQKLNSVEIYEQVQKLNFLGILSLEFLFDDFIQKLQKELKPKEMKNQY